MNCTEPVALALGRVPLLQQWMRAWAFLCVRLDPLPPYRDQTEREKRRKSGLCRNCVCNVLPQRIFATSTTCIHIHTSYRSEDTSIKKENFKTKSLSDFSSYARTYTIFQKKRSAPRVITRPTLAAEDHSTLILKEATL